jgi:membrane protein DedA with SNARE-associated domain
MESLFSWLSHYGYTGLFALLLLGIVGLPIPDEALLVFSGYLISTGRLDPVWTFITAFAGAACGISVSYWLGITLGHTAVERYGPYIHLTQERLERVHRWFRRVGNWLLSIGYFIPGVRHFTAIVAGMSGLEFPTFAIFAYGGAAVWVALFLTLGYVVGEQWPALVDVIQRFTWDFVIAVTILLPLGWLVRRRFRNGRRPL